QLEAIGATARHDYPSSIGAYEKIVKQTTGADQANAYVDLGRAYARSEQWEKAIENYQQAAKLGAQSAGTFLQLGIAYSKRRDVPNAELSFQRSEKTYQILSNHEGLAEVVLQRSVLFYGAGKLADARSEFEKVLAALKS